MDIGAYLHKKLRLRDLIRFCKETVNDNALKMEISNVNLSFRVLPIGINGLVSMKRRGKKQGYNVCLNILFFIVNCRMPKEKLLFYAYNTIVHELQHIKLMELRKAENYYELIAHYEEILKIGNYNLIDIVKVFPLHNKKKVRMQSQASMNELLCNLEGYQAAYSTFKKYLSKDDRRRINEVIRALIFLRDNMAICYDVMGHPHNTFVAIMQANQNRYRRKKAKREMKGWLKLLFAPDGRLWPIEHIAYGFRDVESNVIDGLLINLFICLDIEMKPIFEKNAELKNRFERLTNEYCEKCLYYLEHMNIGEVIFDNDILQDNAAMLIANTTELNRLMQRYDMVRTSGGVIPFYETDQLNY